MKKFFLSVLFSSFTLFYSINAFSEEEAAKTERYSLKGLFRPSVMPTEIVSVKSNIQMDLATKNVGWDIGTDFGITKGLQGSFGYGGLTFNPFAASRSFSLGAKYNYSFIKHLSTSVSLSLPIHVSKTFITDINFGLPAVLYNDYLAGGLFHNLFTLTVKPNVAFAFNFPIWIGTQVYENLWMDLSTSLGKMHMVNENKQAEWKNAGFWQELPITVSAMYAFNHYFDLSANFGFKDVFKASKTFNFGLGIDTRFGKLFS